MSEAKKSILKETLKAVSVGSVFDPDMSEEKVAETEGVSLSEIVDHITGKNKLSEDKVEALKRAAKYNRNIRF